MVKKQKLQASTLTYDYNSNMINKINKIKHLDKGNFFLIAGPCIIEGEEMAIEIAENILEITNNLEIPFIFKGSYRKANRTRLDSFTGIGDIKSLEILKSKAKEDKKIKVVSFSKNFGHQIAITAGTDLAKGEFVAFIDADLQDPPELIIDMYDKALTGYEVVYGKRVSRH